MSLSNLLWIVVNILCLGICHLAQAEDIQDPVKTSGQVETQSSDSQENTFVVGITGLRHALTTGDGNDLAGASAAVSMGFGQIHNLWYHRYTADLYLGPYDPIRNGELNGSFEGTGLTYFAGYSAQSMDLRSVDGGYGFGFGFSYTDLVGRAVGRNRYIDQAAATGRTTFIEDYTVRITNLTFSPAIFFSWFREARAPGNRPDQLITRIEGFELTVGVHLPVFSRYKARYRLIDAAENTQQNQTDSGPIKGHTLFVNVTTFFGI